MVEMFLWVLLLFLKFYFSASCRHGDVLIVFYYFMKVLNFFHKCWAFIISGLNFLFRHFSFES